MPRIEFQQLPDVARVWVFGSRRDLTGSEESELLARVDGFLEQWAAHGLPLTCARDWRDRRFLAIAVDQRDAHASGCSVDGLYRVLAAVERELGVQLLGGGMVHYREASGEPAAMTRDEFIAAAERGEISRETRVFDLTVASAGEWLSDFEKPVGRSWHDQFLPAAHKA